MQARLQNPEFEYLKKWYQDVSGQVVSDDLSLEEVGHRLKAHLEGIIDKLPANIFWLDLNGHILGCNQQMATVLGHEDRKEIIGLHTTALVSPEDAEPLLENNRRAMEQGDVLVNEETATLEGGDRVFISYKSALFDTTGKPVSLVGVSFDITERKQMERDLKIAKEEAEAAHLAKLHFMNNMRHDIRTPLSCVVGSARVLKAMETDPEKIEFIEGILKSSQNLLQMLTNMLEFNHVQSHEKSVELAPVKITKLAQDLVDMLGLIVKGKDFSLSLSIAPGTPEIIHSDSYRLQRILLNLLNNAIKFTHEGTVILRLEPHGEMIHLSVEDSGIGIPPERKHEVFDKFVRLVDSDKGLYEGEGLGLAIVKQFVTELGGTIELQSQAGIGSTFTVILPNHRM